MAWTYFYSHALVGRD